MSRDQYLKGNLSLIIPVADPSKSGEYTCQCDHKNINYVVLVVSGNQVNSIFHGNATLPYSENCSGLAAWVRSNDEVVAQCDQTSCQSIKAGYYMIHYQYLKGDLSLYITDADYSMRDMYTCECDGTNHYDVKLIITALNSTVQMRPGESLVLDLEIPDPVEVLYESPGAGVSSSGQICTVDGCSPQCNDDYEKRVSPALELKEVSLSDSGVYTIRDLRTKEDIHVYTVTIRDDPHPPEEQKIVLSVLEFTGIVVGTAAVCGAAPTEVKVKLNDSATLPCEHRCSGLVRWSQNSSGVVAQCNQTSCLSLKDGFEMFYDQYLKGNLSLIIPVADLSKIGRVNLHGNATLPCSVTCSGLAAWIRKKKYRSEVVAQCSQTSCQSIKAGYQMIHDQYLEGDLSLYITDADYSMRGLYTCQCDGTDHYDVELTITALNSTVQMRPGESLVLDLETPDPVEVLYNSTGTDNSYSGQICTVDGRSLQCSSDYEQRVAIALELKGVNLSDSGVYTIRDANTKEVLYEYTVIIPDDPPNPDKTVKVPWLWLSVALNVVLLVVIMGLLMCRNRISQCEGHEMRCVRSGEDSHSAEEQNILPPDQQ
ncbi:hypothetical protein MHYP_G00262930 [Metynnis hypsauchen]